MSAANNGPMAGTRVVDLTRILAGPFCAMMLGDMGAEIIKVEPPGTGDDTRGWGAPSDPPPWGRLVQILDDGRVGEVRLLRAAEVRPLLSCTTGPVGVVDATGAGPRPAGTV